MMNSSTASDTYSVTDGASARERPALARVRETLGVYGLVIGLLLVAVGFSVASPNEYFTMRNFGAMLGSQAVLVVLTMALIVPLRAGDIDLSCASVLALSANVTAILSVNYGLSIELAVLAALAVGAAAGLINAILCLYFHIDSLIVTLGTGSVFLGITLWISGGATISGIPSSLTTLVAIDRLFGIPLGFYFGLAICVLLWYVFEHTPLGIKLLFSGKNRSVAVLSGVHVTRVRAGALVTCGLVSSLAGVMYVATLGSSDPSSGTSYLLPAFAAAFLGGTSIKPRRFNAWGAFVAVYFLIFGITGLSVLGAQTFVQPMFYGGALVTAVVLRQVFRGRREGEVMSLM